MRSYVMLRCRPLVLRGCDLYTLAPRLWSLVRETGAVEKVLALVPLLSLDPWCVEDHYLLV